MATILLVEDDPLIREMVKRRLIFEKFEVITAADGAKGVEQARTNQPALILMDMGLPILNGWQAAHRIRTNEATAHIPIIALTALSMSEDRARAFASGCDEYEAKPIDFPRLLAKIAQLLQGTDSAPNVIVG